MQSRGNRSRTWTNNRIFLPSFGQASADDILETQCQIYWKEGLNLFLWEEQPVLSPKKMVSISTFRRDLICMLIKYFTRYLILHHAFINIYP